MKSEGLAIAQRRVC